jgi:hypothetical protein
VETILIVVLVVAAAAAVFWWTRRRAAPPPVGMREQPRPPAEPRRLAPPPEQQVLDRNTVLGRNRVFDPSKWDDTPDGSEEDGPDQGDEEPMEDLPRFFDRDYLERKHRGETPEA